MTFSTTVRKFAMGKNNSSHNILQIFHQHIILLENLLHSIKSIEKQCNSMNSTIITFAQYCINTSAILSGP